MFHLQFSTFHFKNETHSKFIIIDPVIVLFHETFNPPRRRTSAILIFHQLEHKAELERLTERSGRFERKKMILKNGLIFFQSHSYGNVYSIKLS